jgi:L-ascorbate metabolism protein UlaG (beta-lactamase superfamily)
MATSTTPPAPRPRRRAALAAVALVSAGAALVLSKCGCVAHHGAASSHFDGSRFHNPEGGYSTADMMRWLAQLETVDWPAWIDDPPQPPPPRRVPPGALRVTYVNHATVLVQVDGVNVLTDPIWSARAGPASWLGAKRVRAPGVPFEQLPPIDWVLVSHDHYDHLDLATLERLDRRDHPTFVVGLGVGALLAARGIRDVVELDWWQAHEREGGGVRVTFVPARHGSGRLPFRRDRTLWGGFVVEAPSGQVYFGGDTALGGFVGELAAAFRRIRLAVLPIGSYEKRWFMRTQHMNPDDAVEVHRALAAARSVGVHFATFAEHPEQALDAHEADLAAALRRQGVPPEAFWVLAFGEGRDVPPLPDASAAQPPPRDAP